MFLSVTEVLITVIRMQCVSTQLEVLGVCVTLDSLEMELHAQVITLLVPNLHPIHHFQCTSMRKACKILPRFCNVLQDQANRRYTHGPKVLHLSHLSAPYSKLYGWRLTNILVSSTWTDISLTFMTTTHGNISLILLLHIYILEAIKYSRWQRPGNSATANMMSFNDSVLVSYR